MSEDIHRYIDWKGSKQKHELHKKEYKNSIKNYKEQIM